MKFHFPGFAFAVLLSLPAVAQSPMPAQMPAKAGAQMPMGASMQGMPADHIQQMQKMMGMMREMMPMMQRMQRRGMTPERRAEMMKKMAPMMQSMMPMMQNMMGGADGHAMGGPAGAATSGSTAAFEAAAMKMHADMQLTYTGDADVDFAKGMIPHHEGAVAMARVLLQYGKNTEMKKFAEDVIKAQTAEIATLRDWLVKNSK